MFLFHTGAEVLVKTASLWFRVSAAFQLRCTDVRSDTVFIEAVCFFAALINLSDESVWDDSCHVQITDTLGVS